MEEKWNHDSKLVNDEESWNRIFNVCHRTTPYNVLIRFQLRIMYRFLEAMFYLNKYEFLIFMFAILVNYLHRFMVKNKIIKNNK